MTKPPATSRFSDSTRDSLLAVLQRAVVANGLNPGEAKVRCTQLVDYVESVCVSQLAAGGVKDAPAARPSAHRADAAKLIRDEPKHPDVMSGMAYLVAAAAPGGGRPSKKAGRQRLLLWLRYWLVKAGLANSTGSGSYLVQAFAVILPELGIYVDARTILQGLKGPLLPMPGRRLGDVVIADD